MAKSTLIATVSDSASARTEREKKQVLSAYKALMKDCLHFTSKEDGQAIRRAFDFSLDAHKDARRRSGEPYILHPLAVARILTKEMSLQDGTSIVCALLHDVVEDTFANLDDIQQLFGVTTAKIIDGLTKISGVFDPTSSKQAETFRKMLLTMSHDIRVALIKLADRLHNMRTLDHTKAETQLKISSETQFLYAPLAHRLGLYNIKMELEDLALKYSEPETYHSIIQKLQETKTQRAKYIQQFIKPIKEKLKAIGMQCVIKSRIKSIASIADKMKVQNIPFEEVYDFFAVRIIIKSEREEDISNCWRAYSAVTSTYRPHPDRLRDWISTPKSSGYESLHTTVMGPKGHWVEVQIRTERMDFAAEKGVSAHWKYKGEDSENDANLEHWLERVRDLLDNNELSALDIVQEFKNNLITEQIFVFTPKGKLITLPQGATALDFAYSIHSNIGNTCIGAKVNSQLVKLSHLLHNGDQVEIITSKKQFAKPEWLLFAKTTRANTKIKDALKDQRREIILRGKELFDWKLLQLQITENHEAVKDLLQDFNIPNLSELYYRLGSHTIDAKKLTSFIQKKQEEYYFNQQLKYKKRKNKSLKSRIDSLLQQTRGLNTDMLTIGKDIEHTTHEIATCCNPIPGDSIIGFSEPEKIIYIHKTNCPKAIELMSNFGSRIVKTKWDATDKIEFLAALKINGQDKMGMLNSIVKVISLSMNKNIRSFTIDTDDGIFEGSIRLFVNNAEELHQIMEQIKKIDGVFSVSRLDN